jgi:8-oxo-dGTP diphosphatase
MKISTICYPVIAQSVYLANKKRGFGAGFLNGYGGKKQASDPSIEAAAIREMKEEGGVTALRLERVAVIDFFEGEIQIFECHVFFCTEWRGAFRESEEMALPEAYPRDAMPYDLMWDADRVWLPLIFHGEKIRARSYYNEGMTKQERFEYEPL